MTAVVTCFTVSSVQGVRFSTPNTSVRDPGKPAFGTDSEIEASRVLTLMIFQVNGIPSVDESWPHLSLTPRSRDLGRRYVKITNGGLERVGVRVQEHGLKWWW